MKKGFLIVPDDIPESDEDVCLEVAKYCAENRLNYEFIKRISPIEVIIDGDKYRVKKEFKRNYCITCWVLSCSEID